LFVSRRARRFAPFLLARRVIQPKRQAAASTPRRGRKRGSAVPGLFFSYPFPFPFPFPIPGTTSVQYPSREESRRRCDREVMMIHRGCKLPNEEIGNGNGKSYWSPPLDLSRSGRRLESVVPCGLSEPLMHKTPTTHALSPRPCRKARRSKGLKAIPIVFSDSAKARPRTNPHRP
jgi:hypothetical protein